MSSDLDQIAAVLIPKPAPGSEKPRGEVACLPKPAIAALRNHIRVQAPSILFRQDELPPEHVIVISNLG
jgi:hypothetical protein